MVDNVKIVIGANFGDEGKGLMTDYFSHQSIAGEKCVVVLHNGGAQRGHTVTLLDGTRHVFHHFGSGTFAGADTYLSKNFILNPIVFREEWAKLESIGYKPCVYIDNLCLLTTPYDMIINQLLEEKRSEKRHGSCGMGIYETTRRKEEKAYTTLPTLLLNDERTDRISYIKRLRDTYYRKRLKELDISLDSEWESIFSSDQMIQNYIDDFIFMMNHVYITDYFPFEEYDTVIFENGQGLLLDQNNMEYFPHLTPSNTGTKNPHKAILKSRYLKNADIEVCYVTRPYLTRHGAGRLDGECNKEDIFSGLEDQTNVPNQFQGTLRYAKLDVPELITRIQKDFEPMRNFDAKLSLAITHMNEAPGSFCYEDISKTFDCIYCSDGVDRDTVSVK